MKQEDFERLKAICEKEGFDINQINSWVIQVQKKDPWDGVEFGRYKFPNHRQFSSFKVKSISEQMLTTEGGAELFKGNCEPITESTYIEQLKKECFERFGEIKEVDRFENVYGYKDSKPYFELPKYQYRKDTDTLYWCGIPIYQSGKWATRLKERVEVKPVGLSQDRDNRIVLVNMTFEVNSIDFNLNGASQFIASQLEAFLNLKDCETSINGEIVSIHIKPKKGADLSKVEDKVQELASLCTE